MTSAANSGRDLQMREFRDTLRELRAFIESLQKELLARDKLIKDHQEQIALLQEKLISTTQRSVVDETEDTKKEGRFSLMHHKLDICPIPESVLYVNDLTIAADVPYQTGSELDKALTGKRTSEGGILPDDNVRVYIPLDLNVDNIMYQLSELFSMLGDPSWKNELAYSISVNRIISQLEIYDQVWAERGQNDKKHEPGIKHSWQGIELAKKIVTYLEEHEDNADDFPYEQIEELRNEFLTEE